MILFNLSLLSQEIILVDETDGQPIESVEIIYPNGKIIESDTNGRATLDKEFEGKFLIHHISYQEKRINTNSKLYKKILDSKKQIRIAMYPKSFLLPEVVTTGNFAPTSRQASVFDVDVITKEVINAQKAPTLREMLQNQANIRISNDPSLGAGISINGLSGQNVKIMIDGVPMIGRENGNINASQINMSNVEQIEIIEGPMSAIYGSGALGGVINIITTTSDKIGMNAKFDSYVENAGTTNAGITSNYGDGNNFFNLNLTRNFFSGWNPEGTNALRSHQWNPREQLIGNARYDRKFDNSRLSYKIEILDEFILNRTEPIDPPYNETGIDNEFNSLRVNNSIFYKGSIGDDKYFDITGNYQYYRREREVFVKDLVTLDRNFVTSDAANQVNDNSNYMFRGVFSNDKLTNNLGFMIGVETNLESMSGNRIEGERQRIEDAATFLSGNLKLFNNRFTIQPLVRLIYNSRYDAPIVPGVNLKVDFTDNFNFRGGLSNDFRAPGLKELYLDFVDQNHFIIGNQDLRAENSYSINGAINYSFSTSGNVFRGEIKSSYNKQNDMISLAQNGFNVESQQFIYTYVNISEFRSQSNEIGFSYLRDEFTVNLASTYIGRWSSLAEELLYSPEFTANVIYYFRNLNLNIAALYKFTGRLRSFGLATGSQIGDDGVVDPEDLYEFEIPGFHNLDITLTKTFWQDRIELIGGIKNAFDVTNLESDQPQGGVHSGGNTIPINWGRTFFVGLNFNVK